MNERAREAAETRRGFFAYLSTLTSLVIFSAWPDPLEALPFRQAQDRQLSEEGLSVIEFDQGLVG